MPKLTTKSPSQKASANQSKKLGCNSKVVSYLCSKKLHCLIINNIDSISSLFSRPLNKHFLTKVQEINAIYGEQQLENISSTINLIKELKVLNIKYNLINNEYSSLFKYLYLNSKRIPNSITNSITNKQDTSNSSDNSSDNSIENIYSNLDYNNYKNDIKLIQNAKYNICFGLGGQLCTSIIFGKSTIVYCKVNEKLNTDNFKKNNFYFTNITDFFDLIKEKCCV